MNDAPITRTREILAEAVDRYAADPALLQVLQSYRSRLQEPLRVALAGRVKSGKSTLLNAIIGEELAPTDTGECTRVVTWYRFGEVPAVRLHPRRGRPEQLAVRREQGRLQLDTGSYPAHEVARLEVTWPAPALRDLVLVDTPGIASLSREVSARATEVLTPDRTAPEVDAVVYLMRHLHASDAELMEAFREASVGGTTPVGTLAVISRADEIGAGRIDAMVSAAAVAERYRRDPRVRALALDVVPVAGLLAQGARTLRQVDFDAVRELARLAGPEREGLLVSADHFSTAEHPGLSVATPQVRRDLLLRLGFYGVRLATALVRGPVPDASALAHELARRSGLQPLTGALTSQLRQRADLLKARTILGGLEQVLTQAPAGGPAADDLLTQVHAVRADDHALVELDWLVRLRRGEPEGLTEQVRAEAEQLPDTAQEALVRWRRTLADPMTEPGHLPLVRAVLRSLDHVLHELPGAAGPRAGSAGPVLPDPPPGPGQQPEDGRDG